MPLYSKSETIHVTECGASLLDMINDELGDGEAVTVDDGKTITDVEHINERLDMNKFGMVNSVSNAFLNVLRKASIDDATVIFTI